MSARWIRIFLVVLAGVGVAFALSRVLWNPRREAPDDAGRPAVPSTAAPKVAVKRPARPSEAYVGSAVCAECHADVSASYQSHPMGHSLAGVLEAAPLEDYVDRNSFDTPPPVRSDLRLSYRVTRSEEGVSHHEIVRDGEGEVLYDLDVPIHYAVGSGQRGRSYVTNRDGRLFMSPVTWYSQERRWDLSPGYEMENLGFERRIVDGCINCHAGRMAVVPDQPDCFQPEPFLEESIGCERCHGPGEQHVRLHRRGAEPGDRDPIVNPAQLEASLRDSVCFQCHLQGSQRVLRYGRSEFDFRPGDHLNDIWAVFVRGTGIAEDQTTEAVSQVEQMLASTCYQQSEGRLGCVSCHDPHSLPEPEARVEFYRSQCLECHGEGQTVCSEPIARRREVTAEDSCIACHMPEIAANDVPHTSQTDHRILRSYDRQPDPTPTVQVRFELFGDEAGRIPQDERERAEGLLLVIQSDGSRGAELLAAEAIPKLEKWLKAAPDDPAALEALGTAYSLLRDYESAYRAWHQALELNPDNENVLSRIMILCHDNGQIKEGAEYARRLVKLNPWKHMYFGRLAHMLGQSGEMREAVKAATRAVELSPANAGIHAWLSEACLAVGDEARARKHRSLAEVFGSGR